MRIAGALSLAVLTASGLVNVALGGLGAGLARVDAFGGLDDRPPRGAGENFLLVGTDGRDRITPAERRTYRLGGLPCHCADTIMLAHLSQDRARLTVVSIPRDTYVRLPAAGHRGDRPAKVNAAYAIGGPPLTVRTVERLTGVRVDHYVEVDFLSFMRTVDAIGGVPVCTALPLRDPKSGLDLPAGRTLLTGGQALAYVRARYVDASADLGRMERQQRFVAELVHRAASPDVLLDADRLDRAVGSALDAVRADPGLGPRDFVRLAESLRDLRPNATEFTSVPITRTGRRVHRVGTTVTWDAPRAAAIFAAIRADRPLTRATPPPPAAPVAVDPAAVRVRVTGADRDAVLRTTAALHASGFRADPSGAPDGPGETGDGREPGTSGGGRASGTSRGSRASGETGESRESGTSGDSRASGASGRRSVIDYDPRWDRSARTLATALPSAALHPVPRLGGVLHLTLGAGRPAVTPVRLDPLAATSARGASAGTLTGAQELCP
jgi:LCP family protein required for cell wall assembly